MSSRALSEVSTCFPHSVFARRGTSAGLTWLVGTSAKNATTRDAEAEDVLASVCMALRMFGVPHEVSWRALRRTASVTCAISCVDRLATSSFTVVLAEFILRSMSSTLLASDDSSSARDMIGCVSLLT